MFDLLELCYIKSIVNVGILLRDFFSSEINYYDQISDLYYNLVLN